jgi:hypothetical protein
MFLHAKCQHTKSTQKPTIHHAPPTIEATKQNLTNKHGDFIRKMNSSSFNQQRTCLSKTNHTIIIHQRWQNLVKTWSKLSTSERRF